MDRVGAAYRAKFDANSGLSGSEKVPFLSAVGLTAEPPMSWSAQGIADLLQAHGPLWVTTDEAPGAPFAIHARIVTRIRGDGSPAGTTISVVDPAGGRAYDENFATFQAKFAEVAIGDMAGGGEPRVQVVHF